MCSVWKHFYFLPSISVSTHHKSVSSRSFLLCFSQEALEKTWDKRQVCESLVSESVFTRDLQNMDLRRRKRQWIVLECSCFKVTECVHLQKVIIRLRHLPEAREPGLFCTWCALIQLARTSTRWSRVPKGSSDSSLKLWTSQTCSGEAVEIHNSRYCTRQNSSLNLFLVHLQFVYASNSSPVPFVYFSIALSCWSQREVLMIYFTWSWKHFSCRWIFTWDQ